jgi:hypothetical protein
MPGSKPRLVVVSLSTIVLITAAAPEPTPLPVLNEKVVAYARNQLGTCVGDGSCTSLAIAALKSAGARYYPMAEPGGEFTWGEPVESFKDALPGDILQFRNAVFRGRKNLPGGRWITWHHEYPHHTAIVSGVSERGKAVAILHQNVTGQGKDAKEALNVQEATIRVDSLQKGGSVRIFRPVAARTPYQRRQAEPSPEPEESPSPPAEPRP